jgi:hypothetical protein
LEIILANRELLKACVSIRAATDADGRLGENAVPEKNFNCYTRKYQINIPAQTNKPELVRAIQGTRNKLFLATWNKGGAEKLSTTMAIDQASSNTSRICGNVL